MKSALAVICVTYLIRHVLKFKFNIEKYCVIYALDSRLKDNVRYNRSFCKLIEKGSHTRSD